MCPLPILSFSQFHNCCVVFLHFRLLQARLCIQHYSYSLNAIQISCFSKLYISKKSSLFHSLLSLGVCTSDNLLDYNLPSQIFLILSILPNLPPRFCVSLLLTLFLVGQLFHLTFYFWHIPTPYCCSLSFVLLWQYCWSSLSSLLLYATPVTPF